MAIMHRILVTVAILLATLSVFTESYSDEDLNEYMEYAMADYKLGLHRATQTTLKRRKRDLTTEDFTINTDKIVHMTEIANITPWQSIPTSYPVELEPFVINGDNYMAVVNFKNKDGGYQTESAVYILNGTRFRLLQNFTTSGGIDFEFADLGKEQYAIFLDHVGQNWYGGTDQYTYMKSFQVNQFLPSEGQNKPFQYRTKVRALGAKKVKVFTKDNMHYFVTANSYHKMGNLYHVKSTMHVQTAYGYQLVQEFDTQGAQDVEVEVIGGRRFLFFANKMDNAGKVDIYSIIYVEQEMNYKGRSPFKLYQRIGTHGARDFEYFTFGGNHYLAVANEYTHVVGMDANTGRPVTVNNYNVDSVIYWWTGTMWVQWQLIPTYGAVKWSYFTSPFGDPMLIVSNTRAPAVILTYDPLRGLFVPTQQQNLSPIPAQPDLVSDTRSVMPYTSNGQVFLAVANYEPASKNGYNVFKVDFEMRAVKALEPTIPEIIMAHLEKMKKELQRLQQSLGEVLEEVANTVMTKSTAQNITSDVSLDDVTITDTLTTRNFYYRVRVNNDPLKINNAEVEKLLNRLNEKEAKLSELEALYNDAVRLNQDASITGKKTVTKPMNIAGQFNTGNLTTTGLIDGTNITELNTKALKRSINQTITGNFTLTKDVTFQNANVEKLNNRHVTSFMTTNTEQMVSGVKTFNDAVSIDRVTMRNFTLNGLRIPEDVVTSDGNHTIIGRKEFKNVYLKNFQYDGLLSGINMTEFSRNKMTLTTRQVVQPAVLSGGFETASAISVGGLVDGVNLTDIGRDRSNEVEEIRGSKTFKSIIIKGHTQVKNLNGHDVNKMVTLNTQQNITADMEFVSLNVDGNIIGNVSIDGKRLSDQVVTKHGAQTINGHKTITAPLTLQENFITNGTIDGVDLKAWYRDAIRKNSNEPIRGTKWFQAGVNITERLNAENVNGIDLNTLRENLIWINKPATWQSAFNFEHLSVNQLSIDGTINNYRIPEDFVPLNTSGTIYGTKTFVNETSIHGNLTVAGNLSGKNFTEFYDAVLKNNTDEIIDGNVVFLNDMKVERLNVTGKINGLSVPDDIVTTSTYQNISNVLNFITAALFEGNVHANEVIVNGTVNGVDISDMEEDAIHKDRNQTINGTIVFVGGIECRQNLSVSGLINNINLTELMEMTVRISRDQNVSGAKTFTKDTVFNGRLTTPGTVNGVNISELDATVLKKNGAAQTFHSNLVVNSDVMVNSLTTNGSKINDVDFERFSSDAVRRKSNNSQIQGNVQFTNELKVDNLVTKLLDGVNVSEVLLTKQNQSVTGNVQFTTATLLKNLDITSGKLNGVNLERLNTKTLKLHGNQQITGNYTLSNVYVKDNVTVTGKINGIDLQEFDSTAVHQSGNETITGMKTFRNVTVDDVTLTGFLNNANVSLLFSDTLKKTGHQHVCQRKTFYSKWLTTTSNTTVADVRAKELVNGVNITKLDSDAVKINGLKALRGNYQFANVHVYENVTIRGILNGLPFPAGYMRTHGDELISGNKTFQNVVFMKNVNMTGYIDGLNISELEENRVTLRGTQAVRNIHFKTVELSEDINFPNQATINGIDVSEELVPVNGPSTISGVKVFNSTFIRGNLDVTSGMVNGVNLTKLAHDTVRVTSATKQIISANQFFDQDLIIQGNLTVSGLVNGVVLSDIRNHSENVNEQIQVKLDGLNAYTKHLCSVTSSILPIAVTEQVLTGIEKVDIFKSFPLGANLGTVHSTQIGDHIYVSVARAEGSGCGTAYILKCDQLMNCEIHQTMETNALQMEFFDYETFDAILVSHRDSGSNDTCKTESEIFVYKTETGRYMPYQTLNQALFQSEHAPVLKSSTILRPYIEKAYGKYKNSDTSTSSDANGKSQRSLPRNIKWFEHKNKNYLVVSGFDQDSNFVDVLHIEGKNLSSIQIKQRIKANGPHVSVGKLNDNRPVIVTSSDGQDGSINMYIYNEKRSRYELYQRQPKGASTVALKRIKNKEYLLHASATNGFGFCEWRGVSGYGSCNQLQATDTKSVEAIITSSGAYVIAGTDSSLLIYRTMFEGNSDLYDQAVC